jgi:hypothetical protein
VTRRRRIDLALLLIIRRAERDAAVRARSPVAEPAALSASTAPSSPAPQAPPPAGRYTRCPEGKQAPSGPSRGAPERREEVRRDEASRHPSGTAPGRPADRRA